MTPSSFRTHHAPLSLRRAAWLAWPALALVGPLAACGAGDPDPVAQVDQGLRTVEAGLTEARAGAVRFLDDGAHAQGFAEMEAGVSEMESGRAAMHQGLEHMRSMDADTWARCGGDHERVMADVDAAMTRAREAMDEATRDGGADTAAATRAAETLRDMDAPMRAGLDEVRGAMRCMGHMMTSSSPDDRVGGGGMGR